MTPVSILFPVSLTLPNADVDWVVVNLRHRGYFRVNYDAENWKALITQLNTDHWVLHRKQRTSPLCQSKSTGNTSQPINGRILLNLNLPPTTLQPPIFDCLSLLWYHITVVFFNNLFVLCACPPCPLATRDLDPVFSVFLRSSMRSTEPPSWTTPGILSSQLVFSIISL